MEIINLKKTNGSKIIFSLLAVILLSTGMVMAQKKSPEQPTRILFLFDASQSMYARWETNTKYEVAKKMLSEMVDSLNDMTNLE